MSYESKYACFLSSTWGHRSREDLPASGGAAAGRGGISTHLIVEKPDFEDVLHVLDPISHGQVPQRVSHQQHVGARPQLLEVSRVEQSSFSLVVNVDQVSLEGPQNPLIKTSNEYLSRNLIDETKQDTYRLVKVHVVGEDVDVGVEHSGLPDHLLQDVSDSSGEDEQRDAVLVQVVEEELEALPVEETTPCSLLKENPSTLGRTSPQHDLRLAHGLRQQILLDLLLHQEIVSFGPPGRAKNCIVFKCKKKHKTERSGRMLEMLTIPPLKGAFLLRSE